MDYRGNNGNDVVLPPTPKTRNRVRKVGRAGGNGLSGSARYPVYSSGELMDIQIRHHEQEAYFSVLKAFKVQSNALSWEKEELITELRRELRVTDDEHREILRRVNDSLPPFCKKQKISPTSGNRGDASHLLRDINSIESAQYYSTGPIRRGVRGGYRVRGVNKSMDHNNNGAVLPFQITKGNIEMVLTESVIDVVEKVLLSTCPNPLEIEHAANLLKNQEESLVCALRCIADASEGEYANNHDPSIEREQELTNNGQPALGAENGMITDGEGGGNVEQGSHESSKVEASNDEEDD